METARQATFLTTVALLAISACLTLLTGNGKPLAAGILLLLLVAFVLIFTNDCEERDGKG